jgi:tRNA nucleotidyltransferase (CCA-adding enzyme)
MVGNRDMTASQDHTGSIAEALERLHPELARVRDASADPVYLVGGAVRDLLLDRGRADIDLVVEGDAAALAATLGAEVVSHERFGTAKAKLDGHEVDIAAARSETYPEPGALPVVEPGADLADDLRRRDFTVNAMAIPLQGEPRLIDPFGGEADLAEKRLRVLHDDSFVDDPTRAIRAARYAARFELELETHTAELLSEANLSTVSTDRRDAELLRLAGEAEAPRAFELVEEWGLMPLADDAGRFVPRVAALLAEQPWAGLDLPRDRALFAAALEPLGEARSLAQQRPSTPSEAVALASARSLLELLLARALGAEWLDLYVSEWRDVELEIDGSDLIAAGVPEGPAVGRGLQEALRRKLDGEIDGREQELAFALDAARGGDGVA